MAYGPGGFPYTSKRGKGKQISEYSFNITGAATQAPIPIDDVSCLTGCAAGSFTQAIIDAHLGTSSEFTAAQYDATALGNDALGIIVDTGGQVDELLYIQIEYSTGTGGATVVPRNIPISSELTDSSLTDEAALGANGNVGIRVIFDSAFDAVTSGSIQLRVHWRSK